MYCVLFLCAFHFSAAGTKTPHPAKHLFPTKRRQEAVTAEKKSEHKKPVSLGYYAKKTLNPFKTDCAENQSIATLLFDSLFVLDSAFKPVPAAASDYEIDGRELRVTLKPSLYFTDGSPLTGEDVIYSFAAAKKAPFLKKDCKASNRLFRKTASLCSQ